MTRETDSIEFEALRQEALGHLRALTGNPTSEFRSGQFEAICQLAKNRQRILLVQRTGWGKSAVYFIATRMLRDRGFGPTLLVSPLLALMRNQITSAQRMGVICLTINSSNQGDWPSVEDQIRANEVDVLLISPERLANPQFRSDVLPEVGSRSGLLVVDEVHCISDWGHDFRPDYRRIARVLDLLPSGVPVIGCTATANDRVVKDISEQLGSDLAPIRGTLARDGLRLHVFDIPSQADRLAWLVEHIPNLPGTGIVYCLTVRDTQVVADWLQNQGINAVAYSGDTEDDERNLIEQALLSNDYKVVVATSALGMGFDKPDLGFVIHYQSPGSPIAYYQQVGRAGRALDESWGFLLSGSEDADIQDYFINSAFPSPELVQQVVGILEDNAVAMSMSEILLEVNVSYGQLSKLLKNLEVDGVVERDGSRWIRTLNRWENDQERAEKVTSLRKTEQSDMRCYIATTKCRMKLLRSFLDDPIVEPCICCDNCVGARHIPLFDPVIAQAAAGYLRSDFPIIPPRKKLPSGEMINVDHICEEGRALSTWGDAGFSDLVRSGKQLHGRFADELVEAAAELVTKHWVPEPVPTWITCVPSARHPRLVPEFAERLATRLNLPFKDVVTKIRSTRPQKTMQNSQQQYSNVRGAFGINQYVSSPVLLVDDMVDSRWTLTAVGWKLRDAGAGLVYPFALVNTAGRSVT